MPEIFYVSGLMSGSSLDGVDLAFCEFAREKGTWDFRIIEAETIPYPVQMKKRLSDCENLELDEIMHLDGNLGIYYAELLNDFHSRIGQKPGLIASHGHTLFHEPEKGITFQAGNGGIMADRTRITVINDFRREDVEQGGQGAPLVPLGDLLLFGKYDACLNLGGFANISYDNSRKQRLAFDVGPANLALNRIASMIGEEFDRDGRIAARGTIDPVYLSHLNKLDYYRKAPPKSLGKEWFRQVFIPHANNTQLKPEDQMSTMVEHIAIQISSAVAMACAGKVLVSGGGALNHTLLERFRLHSGADIIIPSSEIVHFKEAMVFAFLGLLRHLGEINCLSSVTGGKSDLSTGLIHKLLKQK